MSALPAPTIRVIEYAALEAAADPAIADIQGRLLQLLEERQHFNSDSDRVLQDQLNTLAARELRMPSLFEPGAHVVSTESIYHERRIFYRFRAAEPYFWFTGLFWFQFALAGIYLPARNLVVCFPGQAPPLDRLASFNESYVLGSFEPDGQVAISEGGSHPMHMMWNILPALEQVAASDLRLPVACTGQPLGPLDLIFPELAGRITLLREANVRSWNQRHGFQVALGSRTIPPSVRERVRRAARQVRSDELQSRQQEFRARFRRIVWLCVKPDKRTALNQVEFLAELFKAMDGPGVGFILNGVSHPWDDPRPRPDSHAGRELTAQTEGAARLIDAVLALLPADLRSRVATVNGISLPDEIGWSELADFYVCHGGSMQNKIAWIHNCPGVIHSNTRFLAKKYLMPLENAAPATTLPPDLIEDHPEIAPPYRSADPNFSYRIVSPQRAAAFCRAAMDEQLGSLDGAPAQRRLATSNPPGPASPGNDDADHSARVGGLNYLQFLGRLHARLQPATYLEIGTQRGRSLALARCESIAIEPQFDLGEKVIAGKPATFLFQMASDAFFAGHSPSAIFGRPIDLAFLDGLHLVEQLLRDVINTEKHCRRQSVIALHDCLPPGFYMTGRSETPNRNPPKFGNFWTGDVWRLVPVLHRYRPDLSITVTDAAPTGLVLLTALDPTSTVLENAYPAILDELESVTDLRAAYDAYWDSVEITPTADLAIAQPVFAPGR